MPAVFRPMTPGWWILPAALVGVIGWAMLIGYVAESIWTAHNERRIENVE